MKKMLRKSSLVVSIVFLLLYSIAASAQDRDNVAGMVTDRPDQTESPTVVPKGFLQVETGSFYESLEIAGIQEERWVFNTSLLRYGLLENVELRLGWDYEEIATTINDVSLDNVLNGLSPLLLGTKIAIAQEKSGWPEVGFIGHLFLPFSASSDFKPETTGADFRFAFSHTLNERSNISYNLGGEWGDDAAQIAYIYTIAYGYSITDNFGVYAELYGDLPENSSANHLWDAGITYLLSANVQLDATIGSGITDSQDILLSAGLSFRIPR